MGGAGRAFGAGGARRTGFNWAQPEPWTVALVLATGVIVIARHPLARMIGTEADVPAAPAVVATAPAAPPAPAATQAARAPQGLSVVPTHSPRDPFRELVKEGNGVLGSVALPPGATLMAPTVTETLPDGTTRAVTSGGTAEASAPAASAPATSAPTTTAPAQHAAAHAQPTSTCAGTLHTVVAGDSLWTLAARAVKSTDTATVNVAWHKVYRVNRAKIGSNPSLLPVGARLCIPSSL